MLNARLFVLAIAICCWASTQATGQAPPPNGNAKAVAWKASRLPDGHPDLEGFWTNNTATPLQRPNGAGEFLTDGVNAPAGRGGQAAPNRNRPFPDLFGIAAGGADVRYVMRRTSIITDPPDGKIPPMTPEAQKEYAAAQEHHKLHPHDRPEDLGTLERCITWITSGPPMLPSFYNNNYQIVQTHDHVMIMTEMVHEARIIPLDGRPHANIPQWVGDSRGHYEGDMLVVETINFNGKRGWFENSGTESGGEKRPDQKMKVIERFTRTAPDVLLYQFTVDDPGIYTKPWSGEVEMRALKSQIVEYACHEGDQAMELILKGARADEKAAEAAQKKSQ
jgi:hypothetical protein